MARGQVVQQKQDAKVKPIGRSNQNPILDTCLYEMESPGEKIIELEANIIKESIYSQYDVNRNEYTLLVAFINHRKSGSDLSVEDQMIVVKVQETLRKSTAGWDIYCKWKDGSTSWKLSNIKELHPIQLQK